MTDPGIKEKKKKKKKGGGGVGPFAMATNLKPGPAIFEKVRIKLDMMARRSFCQFTSLFVDFQHFVGQILF